jgi:hypothetical protein
MSMYVPYAHEGGRLEFLDCQVVFEPLPCLHAQIFEYGQMKEIDSNQHLWITSFKTYRLSIF